MVQGNFRDDWVANEFPIIINIVNQLEKGRSIVEVYEECTGSKLQIIDEEILMSDDEDFPLETDILSTTTTCQPEEKKSQKDRLPVSKSRKSPTRKLKRRSPAKPKNTNKEISGDDNINTSSVNASLLAQLVQRMDLIENTVIKIDRESASVTLHESRVSEIAKETINREFTPIFEDYKEKVKNDFKMVKQLMKKSGKNGRSLGDKNKKIGGRKHQAKK